MGPAPAAAHAPAGARLKRRNSWLQPPACRSLARLRHERGAQQLELARIDVRNRPELEAALLPTHDVVAVAPCRNGKRPLVRVDRPHKHVDDVLPAPIDHGGDDPAVQVIEPAADEREALLRELDDRRGESDFSSEPRLHDVPIGGDYINEMGGQQLSHVARDQLIGNRLSGQPNEHYKRQGGG
jgi:hypothetical protein